MPRTFSRLAALLLGGLTVLFAGCYEDEKISTYTAPHKEVPGRVRLLAAVVPDKNRTWFFKLSGPRDAVSKQLQAFDGFVRSVRLTGKADPPLTWTAPPGWKQQAGEAKQFRFAEFQVGDKADGVEMTVSFLEGEAGTLINNVNRWREQIGLRPIQDVDLDLFTREERLEVGNVVFVDLAGPGKGGPAAGAGGSGLHFSKPEGWEQLPPDPKGIYLVGFQVGEGQRSAEVTVTTFPGDATGVVANVQRWQKQIGLDAGTDDQVRREIRPFAVGGADGSYVDLTGPALGEQAAQRILGVIVPQGGRTWFIKMKGPAELVGRQKTNFEAFASSLRLDGGKGATK
jgi:hypothetical protein